jgi:hypothetical protein
LDVKLTMAATQDIGLQALRRLSSGEHAERGEQGVPDAPASEQLTNSASQSAEEEWRPSKSYQAILLAAGFAMIFQVFGINAVYGIFQVSLWTMCAPVRL